MARSGIVKLIVAGMLAERIMAVRVAWQRLCGGGEKYGDRNNKMRV